MGWAEDQARKDRDRQEAENVTNELAAWDKHLKDEIGRGCFNAVKAYVKTEVEKYSKLNPAEGMMFFPDTSVQEEQDFMSKIPSFSIVSKDGRRARVYVKYSETRHALLWRCGSHEGMYELRVHENGAGYFVDSSGQPRSPEQLGDELLTRARNAEPNGGKVWA